MDYVYKSSFYHDLEGHKEFNRSFHEGSNITRSMFVLYSFLAVWWITLFDSSGFVLRFLLLSSAVLIIYLVNNSKKGDIQYKRMLQANSGIPVRQEQYFGESGLHVVNVPSGNHFDISYDQFRLVIESKRLLLLVMKHRTCIILDKATLSGGNVEAFFAFLKAHCPNLKGKKPRKTTLGKYLRCIFIIILVLGSIWAFMNIPAFSLADRVFDRLHNDLSYQEMAEELSDMGIGICTRTINDLEDYDATFFSENGYDYYEDTGRYQKVADLLYWEGAGIYDWVKDWDPSNSGIFWVAYWPEEDPISYMNFFEGLNAMDNTLVFENLQEDLSQLDEYDCGPVTVSFDYQGKHHSIVIEDYYTRFDKSVIKEMGKIVDTDAAQLYVCHNQNGGALIYFGTPEEVHIINRRTTLHFRKASGFLA